MLKVKCPNCGAQYEVSFVNPVMQLFKGQLDWKSLNNVEKSKLLVMLMTLILSLGLIFSSFKAPINPNIDNPKTINADVN
tara:strand:- start:43 stop:282 length:240 start_codon:yes stop_codon:yes gene_type:complete